jgi:RimJ/RimL family protein N-acetyltransferase
MIDRTEQKLSLRPATLEDAELLLKWRNDMTTRMASHTVDEVKLEKHIEWLKTTLQNKNRQLYVAEEKGTFVGTVRADFENGVHELSWTVAPEARGQGVGKRMVALLANRIKEPIRAEVKKGNDASSRIAECSGMKFMQEDSNGVLHYQRDEIG